jgi:hypothetical protein
VAHLPDATFGCAEIEAMCRQRDDAELRYERAREALLAMMEGALGETLGEVRRDLFNLLRQENRVLRYKLEKSELLHRELRETAATLQREFAALAHEVLPSSATAGKGEGPSPPVVAAAPPPCPPEAPPPLVSPLKAEAGLLAAGAGALARKGLHLQAAPVQSQRQHNPGDEGSDTLSAPGCAAPAKAEPPRIPKLALAGVRVGST